MNKIRLLITTVVSLASFMVVTMPVSAATSKDAVCEGIGLASTSGTCTNDPNDKTTVESTVKTIVNLLSWATGIAAVIMIIISGLKYITASGDSNSINSAKSTLVYAIVGLVIVALAQVIVRFVLKKATA